MKRQFIYGAMILALASAASSCSDNNIIDSTTQTVNQNKVAVSATTTIGDIDGRTRATLGGDSVFTPVWQKGDKIAVLIDNATDPSELTLSSGESSRNGMFLGNVSTGENPEKMYFFYPASAASSKGIDFSEQDGSNAQEMVMYATCDYDPNPEFTFTNKTSVLKLNIPVPEGSGWTESTTGLSAIIKGVYSKGTLSKDGTWSCDSSDISDISVSNITVKDNKLTGYVVVIPGTGVTGLRIIVTDGNQRYVTSTYTNSNAKIPENNVVSINTAITKKLLWLSGITKAADVTDYLSKNGTDLTIDAFDQMTSDDFTQLKNALSSMAEGSINLTISNQDSLPKSAFLNCKALNSVYCPDVTEVGEYCLKNTSVTGVSFPKLKAFNNYFLYEAGGLQWACFATLDNFNHAKEVLKSCKELAFGSSNDFNLEDQIKMFFQNGQTSRAANITLYLKEDGYEYTHFVDGNKWHGVTFKAIKPYSTFIEMADGYNPPSMNINDDEWK